MHSRASQQIALRDHMHHLDEEDLRKAEIFWWYNYYPFKEADIGVAPFLTTKIKPGRGVGLKQARLANLNSAREVATRLGVSHVTYINYELSEVRGSISLNTLARAAEALDCELVYTLRPKSLQTFSRRIWEELVPLCLTSRRKYAWNVRHTAIAALARDFMLDIKKGAAINGVEESDKTWLIHPSLCR